MTGRGRVSIVGAGPGDPELITVRGLARVRSAEVLVYDRLVHPDLVAEAPGDAELVYVGKSPDRVMVGQRDIERVLVGRARAGMHVVRLKGGDPFVFGRGGEEVAALVAAGIPIEVVPGVTSAVAAPGAAGIPVTHRGLSTSLTIVTGHDSSGALQGVDWEWMARGTGTLVILMGLRHLGAICARLIAEGKSVETPAAVISAGTLPAQRCITGTLADLPRKAAVASLPSPSLIVVGEVVALQAHLGASNHDDEAASVLDALLVRAS